jgi:hypothetical protein
MRLNPDTHRSTRQLPRITQPYWLSRSAQGLTGRASRVVQCVRAALPPCPHTTSIYRHTHIHTDMPQRQHQNSTTLLPPLAAPATPHLLLRPMPLPPPLAPPPNTSPLAAPHARGSTRTTRATTTTNTTCRATQQGRGCVRERSVCKRQGQTLTHFFAHNPFFCNDNC